jgi:succinyl-diaminopimelate desuccinylase
VDYAQILSDLISIDTSVPPGNNYEKAIDYLVPLFEKAGCATEKIPIPSQEAEGREGRVNLICRRPASGKPSLIFYAHIDVVPAQGWPAFQPRIENGKIYGRGAADMKGAIPALLGALEECRDQKAKYDVSVIVTTDEELSQASQLRYLSKFLKPARGAIFFDLDTNFQFISIAGLGALQMEIRVKGKAVHSGLSNLGENAVEKAVPILNALLALKNKVVQRKSAVPVHPATGLTTMVPRLNINMVQGGLKVNIIPDECLISIDRRLVPEEKIEDARKEIMDALSSVPGVRWEIASEFTIPSLPVDTDPLTDELAAILKQVTGEGGKYGEMGSGDLSSIVVNEWGGRKLGLGVIRSESNIHGKDEFVYQKDMEDLAEIICRFMT